MIVNNELRVDYFNHNDIDRETIIYGAGALGDLALAVLSVMKISPKYVVDKNKSGKMDSLDIIRLDDVLPVDKENSLFLICISTISYNSIVKELTNCGIKHVIHFYTYAYLINPSIMSNGWIFEKDELDMSMVRRVRTMLIHDRKSLAHYFQFLEWKKSNIEISFAKYPVATGEKYWETGLFRFIEREVFFDVGAYYGGQTEKYIKRIGDMYSRIVCFEPLKSAFDVLNSKFCKERRIECRNCGLGVVNELGSFDSSLGMASKFCEKGKEGIPVFSVDELGEEVSLMKIHVEGDELNVLKGAQKSIICFRPVVMVLADHNVDGAFSIPLFFERFEKYRLFFRLHDYCGNSAVFYAVPEERLAEAYL